MMQSRQLVRGVFLSKQWFSPAHQVSSNAKEKIVASIEEANDSSQIFSRKFRTSTPFSKVSLAFHRLKEAKVTDFVKKGYDVMKDELYGKPSPRKHLEYTPPPTFKGETSTRKDIGVPPSNSDSNTIFQESDSAMAIKEITRRDPSFSLMDFVAEVQEVIKPVLDAYIKRDIVTLKKYCTPEFVARCEAEHKAFHSRGTFLDNKILYVSEVVLNETKMMGTSPMIVVSFQTQELHCVLDRNGAITEGDKDTIHYMYNEWAMQRIDPEELGEGAIYPIWKLRETQQSPYLPE